MHLVLKKAVPKTQIRFQTVHALPENSIQGNDLYQAFEGHTIAGYRIEKKLGQGGMGAVFLATHIDLQRKVAIKVLPPLLSADQQLIDRFCREAQVLAQLDDPNIVPLFDLFKGAGLFCIVMGFASGGSVQQLIRKNKRLGVKLAARIVSEAALGLWRATKKMIIHRDIKPDNLLLSENGTVKIADFGLAKAIQDTAVLTRTGSVMGTPAYMSVEQWKDTRLVDHRSDLYSLGCTLYEMLTGKPPFEGPATANFMMQHLLHEPPDLGSVRPSLCSEIIAVAKKLVSKNPDERFQTGEDVAQALRCIVGDIGDPGSSLSGVQSVTPRETAAACMLKAPSPANIGKPFPGIAVPREPEAHRQHSSSPMVRLSTPAQQAQDTAEPMPNRSTVPLPHREASIVSLPDTIEVHAGPRTEPDLSNSEDLRRTAPKFLMREQQFPARRDDSDMVSAHEAESAKKGGRKGALVFLLVMFATLASGLYFGWEKARDWLEAAGRQGDIPDSSGRQGVTFPERVQEAKPKLHGFLPQNGEIVNTPRLSFSFQAEEADPERVTVNGQRAVSVARGGFAAEIELKEGANTLQVVAQGARGSSDTLVLSVVLDTVPPKLRFEQPRADQWLQPGPLIVKVHAPEAESLWVDGRLATKTGGIFVCSLEMQHGLGYQLEAAAIDAAGNPSVACLAINVKGTIPKAIFRWPLDGSWLQPGPLNVEVEVLDAEMVNINNGQATPTEVPHVFRRQLQLSEGQRQELVIDAWDRAGNRGEAHIFVHVDGTSPAIVKRHAIATEGRILVHLEADERVARVDLPADEERTVDAMILEWHLPDAEQAFLDLAVTDLAGNQTEFQVVVERAPSGFTSTEPWNGWMPAKAQEAASREARTPVAVQNTEGMLFSLIPAGTFSMGSPELEEGRAEIERPHQVSLTRSFYLKATEVTHAEFEKVMGFDPSRFENAGDDAPVEQVTWYDAVAFCNALSVLESLEPAYMLRNIEKNDEGNITAAEITFRGLDVEGYRLPSEAEWEYACRSGTQTPFHSVGVRHLDSAGVYSPEVDDIAWYLGNSRAEYDGAAEGEGLLHKSQGPQLVMGKDANSWGLYDMSGNVWEWCWDFVTEFSGDTIDPLGAQNGSHRALRGGGWAFSASDCRSANRGAFAPGERHATLGFRIARSLGSSRKSNRQEAFDLADAGESGDRIETGQGQPRAPKGMEPVEPWWKQDRAQIEAAELSGVPIAVQNSLQMSFSLIPAGRFLMGSSISGENSETPHEVILTRSFYVMATEVTQAQFEAVMGFNPSLFSSAGKSAPVEMVTWFDGVAFCNKISELEGLEPAYVIQNLVKNGESIESAEVTFLGLDSEGYRLLTEAEWEFSCRAGTTTSFWTGDHLSRAAANYNSHEAMTRSTGTLDANPWGLYDVHGNVWEWCWDYRGAYDGDVTDPIGPTGSMRVIRGGSWSSGEGTCRSATRGAAGASALSKYMLKGIRPTRSIRAVRASPALADVAAIEPWWAPARVQLSAGGPVAVRNLHGMEFALIPAGSFAMGSPGLELARDDDETQHEVSLTRSFYMAATEVTQAQFKRVMGFNPSAFRNAGDDSPVEQVTWYDAVGFCNALSESEGIPPAYTIDDIERNSVGNITSADVAFTGLDSGGYRLPTEAEWEYACRAGTMTALYTGQMTYEDSENYWSNELDSVAWYCGNSAVDYEGGFDGGSFEPLRGERHGTKPAKGMPANPWGLYDMPGNVWEWCWDWYDDYPSGLQIDPLGPPVGPGRSQRGGSWVLSAKLCRSADRTFELAGNNAFAIGFRPVRSRLKDPAIRSVVAPVERLHGISKLPAWWTPDDQQNGSADLHGIPVAVENSQGKTFVLVPAGSFTMGSPDSELGRSRQETEHEVTLTRSFYLATTEVTQAEFEGVMGFNPSRFRNAGSDAPVERVSWYDAVAFCNVLSESEGLVPGYAMSKIVRNATGNITSAEVTFHGFGRQCYRLPTESEWEYACRAGSTTALYSGGITYEDDDQYWSDQLDAIAWYGGNSEVGYKAAYDGDTHDFLRFVKHGTAPVGGKAPNGWGLYDMLGSVLELCWDWHNRYPRAAQIDPLGTADGSHRIARGGAWGLGAKDCRSASRNGSLPGDTHLLIGFRVVRQMADD